MITLIMSANAESDRLPVEHGAGQELKFANSAQGPEHVNCSYSYHE